MFEDMKKLFAELEADYAKFNSSGNKSAGTRARKACMEIAKAAKALRTEIQEKKNEAEAAK